MPFQVLDLILIGIMLISGLLALMRGFTREVLSLVAWGLAALAAYFAFQQQQFVDLVMPYVNNPTIAKVVVAAAAFVVVLIVVSVISVKISDSVVDSSAGAFDRTLGFLYGLARGLVLVALAYLFYGFLVPYEKQEDWVRNAQSLSIIQTVSSALLSVMPPDIAKQLTLDVISNPEGNTGVDQAPVVTPDPNAVPAQGGTTTTGQ
ncbi:MAG: CvpA family protein [Proteobacteria bacterium]|nr:CvpA family protein [Pseudomonadota bacterium]